MFKRQLVMLMTLGFSVMLIAAACSKQPSVSYKDSVETALDQAGLKQLSVSEDADKNTITLTGAVDSQGSKDRADAVAKANSGSRIVVNEIGVQPPGAESEAKDMASNLDDGIENNYKAALISKGLDSQDISFDAKNGVLTLKGSVKTPGQRKEAQQLAQAVPNVHQVLNQIDVKR